MEKEKDGRNINDILNQEFFDTIKLSKKINSKAKKINELNDFFNKNPNYIELPEIKNKIQDLLNLLLTNLNENNNNYVLAQMELIKTLSQTLNKEESFKNFTKLSLPKLFDKFYLGNTKINDTLIEIFDRFISFKILSIKDYYQYIENIPLEDEDSYRINIINFLYNHINKDESILLNNLPKPINELIKKLVNDNESDISETASKILNILINRDKDENKDKDNNINNDKNNNNTEEYKGKSSAELFVKNIVTAIKNESNKDGPKEKINNNEKKEEESKKEIMVENKNEEKKEENKNENKVEEKKDKIDEEKQSETIKENNDKKEQKLEEVKIEEKKVEKIKQEMKSGNEPKKVNEEDNKMEEKKEVKKEEKDLESKVEEKKDKTEIEIKGSSDSNALNDDKKNEENKEDKKEEKTKLKKGGVGAKRTGIKSQISKFRKNLGKNKKKGDGFEFELVEKKKDGNVEKNEIIPEEKDNNNNDEKKEPPKEESKKEESKKEEPKKEEPKKEEPKKKEPPKEEPKKEESKKEEPKKEELKKEEPKKEEPKKEEPKKEQPKKVEPKKELPKKEIKKNEPKKEKKEVKEVKNEENINDKQEQNEETPIQNSLNIAEINKQSLDEFEKKLQLALEQEQKDNLLNKNSNENLNDNQPTVKQKKEDPKFDEIKSILGKEIIDSLFSPKWEVKKHGFELINEFINSKPNNSYNINDLLEYMKLKLKNYKETNFNINREAINIYNNMIKKKIITKDLLGPIIIAYHEKMADIKLKDNLIELVNNSFDIIEPNTILKQILGKISKKNNAKLLIEYATFLGNIVEEYDVKDLPNKEIIEFCKVLANNSNPQVRTAAISLLCILYKYLGKDVKTLTRDIKESTLKLIDAELDKVQVIDPKQSAGKKKKIASTAGEGKSSSGGGDLIPPQDISKKITPQIIKDLNGKWAEKKEACENIEKILNAANMRILPNGLNNIMTTFKKKLSDSNKNFVKMIVALLSKFIEALKQGFKQWAKPIALALIPNLADKNQLMRNECQNCFDKWVEFCGFDSLVIHFPQFLKTDNAEMRIEIMNFFVRHKDKFNKTTGELVYKDMMNPLLICLQDRSSTVRNAAEEIIKSSLNFIPINSYYKKIEDFKPAIAKTLKQILDKIKRDTANTAPQENNNSEPDNNPNQHQTNTEKNTVSANKSSEISNNSNSKKVIHPNTKKTEENSNVKSNTSKKKNSIQLTEPPSTTETGIEDSDKNDNNNSMDEQLNNYNTVNFSKTTKKLDKDSKKNSSKINVKRAKPKRKLSEDDLVNPLGTAMNKQMPATSVAHLASNSTILKKIEKKSFQKTPSTSTTKTATVFLMNVKVIPNKAKRYEKDKRTKFNVETVSKDYFNKLKDQCKGLFVEDFSKKIFSDDFRKQVEAFKEMKGQIDKKINIPIYFDNLDLILKIIGIKIMNNLNPTLMKNFFEFLNSLYLVIFENKYKLNETESNIIINILIDKLSLNNNTLREHLFSLLNQYIELMDTNKIMVTVINVALNKNNKIKTDILDFIIDLTTNQKLNISTKTYAKLLCKFLPIYDNVIRTKTVTLFQEIYSNVKNELWNMIEISEKDKEFLEENLCLDNDEEEEEEGDEEQNNKEEKGNNIIDNKNNDNEQNNITNINNNGGNENANNINNAQDNNIFPNQNGPLTKEQLIESLGNLLLEDNNEKLNTIIIIHEIVCGKFEQNKDVLISNVDKIITTFKTVSHELFFVKDLKTIPIKFAKYLAIVLCKLASNKELISNLSYDVLLDLSRELLNYLLINGLDKIGDNQEGNIIFKSINSTMLRVLENCDTTFVIKALLELIKEFQDKDDKNLISLAVKCLLKTTHNLSDNINTIKIDEILLQIHLLLLSLQKDNPDAKKKHNINLINNTVQSIVGDFVKLKKEKILEDYSKSVKNHPMNDKYLLKWIKIALDKK